MLEKSNSQTDVLQRVIDIRSNKGRVDIEYELWCRKMSVYASALNSVFRFNDVEYAEHLLKEINVREMAAHIVGPENAGLN